MDILFLTRAEHGLLQQRFPNFSNDYTYAEENHHFDDSARRMMLRLSLVRLHSPSLIELRTKITAAATLEDAVAIIGQHDLKGVPDDDLSQIVFALGPDVIGQVIWMLIHDAKEMNVLDQVCVLSFLRHEVLSAYAHAN